jgi:hypothetical protein
MVWCRPFGCCCCCCSHPSPSHRSIHPRLDEPNTQPNTPTLNKTPLSSSLSLSLTLLMNTIQKKWGQDKAAMRKVDGDLSDGKAPGIDNLLYSADAEFSCFAVRACVVVLASCCFVCACVCIGVCWCVCVRRVCWSVFVCVGVCGVCVSCVCMTYWWNDLSPTDSNQRTK